MLIVQVLGIIDILLTAALITFIIKNYDLDTERLKLVEVIETQKEELKKSKLLQEDIQQRIEEFKKHPIIACMTDSQVNMLSEILTMNIRKIMEDKSHEYVN